MGNALAKMCNCSSCAQENTKDDEEISKEQSNQIDQCKGTQKPLIEDSMKITDLSKQASNGEIDIKISNRLMSPTNLAIINEQQSDIAEGQEYKNDYSYNNRNYYQNLQQSNLSHSNNSNPHLKQNSNTKDKENSFNKDNCSSSINCNKSNDFFLHKNNIFSENVNENWRKMAVTSFVSESKLYSNDQSEIMFKGTLNKLVLSHLKKNCSTNVEKFYLLTKSTLAMYNSKENCLLMAKPQHNIQLKNIVGCKRIDLNALNILKLQGYYFFYIEIKANDKEEIVKRDLMSNDEDMIREILKKEKEEHFFVLFSQHENIVNQWVSLINYFLNNLK